MRKELIIPALILAGTSFGFAAVASEVVIEQMPSVGGGTINQIDTARLFRDNIEPMFAAATASALPPSSRIRDGNVAQIVQSGMNNQGTIMQSGNGRASIWQNG